MPKVMASGSRHGGAGRRGRGRRVSTALAEINVVPLVDVMLVLLIIFMVAAPMMQRGIDVNLPQSRQSPPMPASEPIYVTVPLDVRAQIDSCSSATKRCALEVSQERVRQKMETRDDKQVFLRGDGGVQHAAADGRHGPAEGRAASRRSASCRPEPVDR